ncbi:MAG: AAA family ATPase [Acidobacteriia bacterium]|nr:AAA family ATPase [Terriglobia bacterium]
MYSQLFGLREDPFNTTPDPRFLFLTQQHRKALAGLTYAVLSAKRFIVLTGDIGTGKTTLLQTALRYLPETRCQCSVILNPTLTVDEALEATLQGFGVAEISGSKVQRLSSLGHVVQQGELLGKVSILIVDEAHKASPQVLEEIRLLGNFESLQIVLAGQPELNEVLNREDLRQLKQRIAVRLSIEPLSSGEVEQYIEHRWHKAGGAGSPPFSPEALAEIVQRSDAIPRLINSICDNALTLAYEEQASLVTARHVSQAAAKLDIAGAGDAADARRRNPTWQSELVSRWRRLSIRMPLRKASPFPAGRPGDENARERA